MMNEIKKLKWQIHAETSISQATMWLVVGLLVDGWWSLFLVGVMIAGNVIVAIRASAKLGNGYLKHKQEVDEHLIPKGFKRYDGDYEKFWYDVVSTSGTLYKHCWPNAGNFHSTNGFTVPGDMVLAIKKSNDQ